MRVVRSFFFAALVLLTGYAVTRADESSHKAAAEELLSLMEVQKTLDNSIDQMLDLQVKSQPALAPYRGVMKKFLAKHLSWDSLKDEYIKMYVTEFTEAELKEMSKFYKTPAGKKMIQKLPVLTAKGMQLGAERVRANQDELRKMIADEGKK